MGIRVELELVDGSFVTRMLHAGESVAQFNRAVAGGSTAMRAQAAAGQLVFRSFTQMDTAAKGFLGTMRDVSIVLGAVSMGIGKVKQIIGGMLGDIVKVNAEFESLTVLMKSMSRSADPTKSAAADVARLRSEAMKTPFSLHALQDSMVKLKAAGLDPLKGSLSSLTDAVAAFGGTDEALKRVTLAVTQMSGKGVIQMEELRQQLGEAVPQATELMARSMGVTYADLMAKIATGTVTAKPALQALFNEFTLTFGGASLRMMDTYNGQIIKTTTLLQSLALRFGPIADRGGPNFFDDLKVQLADFNNFLNSKVADKIADMFNSILVDGVRSLRGVIDWIIKFRMELGNVVKVGAWLFGGTLAFKGLVGLTSSISGLIKEFSALNKKMIIAETMANRLVALRAGDAGVIGSKTRTASVVAGQSMAGFYQLTGPAAAQFGAAGGRTMAVIKGLIGTIGLLGGILPILGMGLYAAANHFDLFGTHAREAREELEAFGASSMKQVQETAALMNDKRQLLKDMDSRHGFETGKVAPERNIFRETNQYAVARNKLAQEIAEWDKLLPGYKADARAADAQKSSDAVVRILSREIEDKNRIRNEDSNNLSTSFTKGHDELVAAGKDTTAYDLEMANQKRAMDLSHYDWKVNFLKVAYEKYAELGKRAGGEDITQAQVNAQQTAATLSSQLVDANQEAQSIRQQLIGVQTGAKGINIESLLKKGADELERMKEESSGLKSALLGGTTAAGELIQILNSGKYGDSANPRVADLIEQLKSARSEADALDEALNFMSDSQSLYDQTLKKFADEEFEHLSKNKNPLEIYQLQQKRLMENMSPAARMAMAMNDLKVSTDSANQSVTGLITSFVSKLFGADMAGRGNTIVGILDQMIRRIHGIADVITGIGDKSSGPHSAFSRAGARVSGYTGSGDYLDALIGSESGGNSNAKNPLSSASGIGQFIKSTWMEFLQEMHPELVGPQSLGLRSDNALNIEALKWFTSKNAAALQEGGAAATNPNLYLAHFLGSGGALQVLGASLATPLANILKPAVMQANPFMMGKTAGWLQDWSAKKMGTSTPYAANVTVTVRGANGEQITLDKAAKNVGEKLAKSLKIHNDEFWEDHAQKLAEITAMAETTSEAEAKLTKEIKEGHYEYGRDPKDVRYKPMFNAINEVIDADKKMKEQLAAGKETKSSIENNAKDLDAAARELTKVQQAGKKNPYSATAEGLQQIIDKYDILIERARVAAGGKNGSLMEKSLLAQKQAEIALYQQADVASTMNTLREKSEAIAASLGTEKQQRKAALAVAIAEQEAYLTNFRGTEEQRAQIAGQVSNNIALLRVQEAKASESAWSKQMAQWKDLATNMDQWMTSSIDSISGAFADFITGKKVDIKALADQMISQFARVATNFMMSSLMGGGSKSVSPSQGGAAKGGIAKLMGTAHTGGIIGRLTSSKMVNPLAFSGAHKFHSGGLIRGLGLSPGEVPMIGKVGEGVFTKEQMKAMGNSRGGGVQISMPITVNANGGSAAQNKDLAEQVGRQVENQVRGIVVKELQEQMRPGNMLGRA